MLHWEAVAVLAGAVAVTVTVTGGGTFQGAGAGVATARTERAISAQKRVRAWRENIFGERETSSFPFERAVSS